MSYNINKIDNKDSAYIVGFIAADGHITENNRIDLKIGIADREILEYISNIIGEVNITDRHITDLKRRIHPHSRIGFRFDTITMFLSGRLKDDRSLPIVKESLNKYLIQGFFDGDGCITWGYRKDRNRLWQKVSFTSSFSLLNSLQKKLLNYEISTTIQPKTGEDCFVMEFSNELDVFKFFKIINTTDYKLKRKYVNYLEWLEATKLKYSFNVGDTVKFVDPRTLEKYGVDYSNYKLEKGSFKIKEILPKKYCKLDSGDIVPINLLTKQGISNYALRLELDEFGETI